MSKPNMNLGIAYATKKKASKKMAEGGNVSAKAEKRPMPDQETNAKAMESRNSGDKAPSQDKMTDTPERKQASKGLKTTPIKYPRMVASDALQVRLRDQEDDLDMSAKPGQPKAQPPKVDDEVDAKKSGKSPHPMKMMAKGGMINDDVSMKDAEEDMDEHPPGLESDDDEMGDKDAMDDHMVMLAEGGDVDEDDDQEIAGAIKPANVARPDGGYGAIIFKGAEGGEIDGGDEMEDDMHDSIADAIMAKRDRMPEPSDSDENDAQMMAEGGQVDINANGTEDTEIYNKRNKEALLKENFDSDMGDVTQPMDSNEHADLHEADEENLNDMVSKIRRKIAMKRNMR